MTAPRRPLTVLAISSYFKGNTFLEAAKRDGCTVLLLTIEKLLSSPWCREFIDDVFAIPAADFSNREQVINAVSYLARTRDIDRIVPLDDFDVEVAAMLREHMRLPGMGETTARYFRDKLAMRERAHDNGIRVPRFVHVLNHAKIRNFLEEVPGPWMFKPRSSAAAIGIKKMTHPDEVWAAIQELGDQQHSYLLEEMIPGDVYHVDAIHYDRKVLFAAIHKYRRPLFNVVQGGGIFGTVTVPLGSPEENEIAECHARVMDTLGYVRGVSHTEFIRDAKDGQLHFLETAARVGGAHIADLVEHSRGPNLWAEWAKIEIRAGKQPYTLPPLKHLHGGLVVSLAKDEHPDTSAYDDPEVCWRLYMKHHVGLVVCSENHARIVELMDRYEPRILTDFTATLPPPDKPTD